MADVLFNEHSCLETREWLQQMHAEQEKKPQHELFSRFSRDTTIHVVNQASQFIQQAFDWRAEGEQGIDETQYRKAKCCMYLYYRVLEGVVVAEEQQGGAKAAVVVQNINFVEALLLCAVELVCMAWHRGDMLFPAATIQLERLHLAFDMWEATDLFRRDLAASTEAGRRLPVAVVDYLAFMRVRITEELAFLNGSTLFDAMLHGGGGCRAKGDKSLVANFIATAAEMARERCFHVCIHLAKAVPSINQVQTFEEQVQDLLAYAQANQYQVFFNQHQLNVISCCIYAVSRVLGVRVTFRTINEAISATFPLQRPELFSEADVGGDPPGSFTEGSTREFYNEVFLPPLEAHLEKQVVAAKATRGSETPAKGSGQTPDSKAPGQTPANSGPSQTTVGKAHPAARRAGSMPRTPLATLSVSDRNAR